MSRALSPIAALVIAVVFGAPLACIWQMNRSFPEPERLWFDLSTLDVATSPGGRRPTVVGYCIPWSSDACAVPFPDGALGRMQPRGVFPATYRWFGWAPQEELVAVAWRPGPSVRLESGAVWRRLTTCR